MKRTISKLLGLAALAIAGLAGFSAPAHATGTCTYYNDLQGIYPSKPVTTGSTTTYFAICLNGTVNTTRRDEIVNAIKQLPRKTQQANPDQVRDSLEKASLTYFYFDDRASGNAWLSTHGYPSIYQDSGGRCGHTVGGPSGLIISLIYDRCTLAGNVGMNNPNLRRTTLHETGHALALTIAKNAGNVSNGPDISAGWKQLVKEDIPKLTPPQWFNVWNQPQRENYLCVNVFKTTPPSALELDFGATSNPVCSGNPVAPIDGNEQRTPTEITQLKLPYFVAVDLLGNPTSNVELWAQLFVIRHDSTAPTQTGFLKLTDQVLGFGNGWNDTTANFHCAKVVMQYYYTTLKPPSSAVLSAQSCNANPGSFGSN